MRRWIKGAGGVAFWALVAWQIGTHQQAPQAAPPALWTAAAPAVTPQTIAKLWLGQEGQRLVIRANSDNQCYVEARVNASTFTFLIDTGASSIVFGPQHARQLGLKPSALRYQRLISTANGTGRAADIRLRELRIGDFILRDVEADVVQGGLENPLLGASVLKLLHLEYANGSCILTLPRRAAVD